MSIISRWLYRHRASAAIISIETESTDWPAYARKALGFSSAELAAQPVESSVEDDGDDVVVTSTIGATLDAGPVDEDDPVLAEPIRVPFETAEASSEAFA